VLPTDEDYARLLAFRTRLREFDRWSQERAATQGLTTAQHQLLLAVRGHADQRGPTISEVAQHLLVRHHTAVGLVDRVVALGLVERAGDADDHRVVRLVLTKEGKRRLGALSADHLEELARLGPMLTDLTQS
jgi:DNA-binding MarR family transcriptional regulator